MTQTNTSLSKFLESLKRDIEKATSQNDLLASCKRVQEFLSKGGSLNYNYTTHWIIIGIALIIGGIYGYMYFTDPQWALELDLIGYGIWAVIVLTVIITGFLMSSLAGTVEELSELMFSKDVLFDNSIVELEIKDGEEEYERMKSKFGDFDRGDEDQQITDLYKGCHVTEKESRKYQHYTFEYVVVTYVPSPGPKGTVVMRRVETTHYRYGVICEFKWVKGIAIKACGGGSYDYSSAYRPGSESFNRTYDVLAVNEHVAAKFLQPAVIVALEEIAKQVNDIAIEINKDGEMCISFDDSDFIEMEYNHSLYNPEEFSKEIALKNCPVRLNQVLSLIDKLEEFNDENF